jgi:predicted DNA-binding antitoxin AbrB/MazE fold protein
MAIQIEAIYENGVLKPLRPLDLTENKRFVIVIKEDTDESDYEAIENAAFLESLRREAADYSGPVPSIEEVRKITSRLPGSLSQEIIDSRGPR